MAEVDEDLVTRPGIVADEDVDLSDETQDFRFLAALNLDGSKIPKRGEKDFEPHDTALQSNTLAASRLAMHNALSVERIHNPKGHTVATYHPETNMAYAQNPKGVWIAKMGQVLSADKDPLGNDELRGQRLWLLPEEALYLIERGTLDIRWPGDDELPMSLQAAYGMFIGNDTAGLTFERYSVYSALRRGGYTVLRAPSWNTPGPPLNAECFPPPVQATWTMSIRSMLEKFWTTPEDDSSPIVKAGLYRSYKEIYRRLALIQYYDPTVQRHSNESRADSSFRVTYHVFKPSNTQYKKTSPGPPDFRIAVVNAQEALVPTMDQLNRLMETVPYVPPKPEAHFYAKLKHGYKSVILAVVDQGVTSYIRFADSAFGNEKLYERDFKGPGAKRGGRGGRGRGRGR